MNSRDGVGAVNQTDEEPPAGIPVHIARLRYGRGNGQYHPLVNKWLGSKVSGVETIFICALLASAMKFNKLALQ